MSTTKDRMLQARELIQQKRYDEARKLLQGINHPKAQEWLDKINQVAPPAARGGRKQSGAKAKSGAKAAKSGSSLRPVILLASIALIVVLGLVAFFALGNGSDDTASASGPASADAASRYGAEFMPANTVMYANIRTDDAYINQIDTIVNDVAQQVFTALPPELMTGVELPPTENLVRNLLNEAVLDSDMGGDFDTVVRSWLGARAALGAVMDEFGDPSDVLLVVDVTDRAAAEQFLRDSMTDDYVEGSEGAFTTFFPTEDWIQTYIAVDEKTLYLASTQERLPLNGAPADNLANNAQFTATMNAMPTSSYNIIAYLDGQAIVDSAIMEAMPDAGLGLDDAVGGAEIFRGSLNGIGVGATLLEDRSLTVDVVVETPLLGTGAAPVDPGFLASVPAGADFIIHTSDLNGVYTALLDNLIVLANADPNDDLDATEIQQLPQQIDGLLMMAAGLSFQEDIIGWMTGDLVIFMDYTIPEPGAPSLATLGAYAPQGQAIDLGIEMGVLIEATDGAKARALVDALAGLVQMAGADGDVTVEQTQIAGENALLITLLEDPTLTQPVQVAVVANDRALYIGTAASAEAALGGNGGFNNDATYQASQAYWLGNANSVWYAEGEATIVMVGDGVVLLTVLGPAIGNVFADIMSSFDPSAPPPSTPVQPDPQELLLVTTPIQQAVRDISGIMESTTITTAYSDGFYQLRAVITLGQ